MRSSVASKAAWSGCSATSRAPNASSPSARSAAALIETAVTLRNPAPTSGVLRQPRENCGGARRKEQREIDQPMRSAATVGGAEARDRPRLVQHDALRPRSRRRAISRRGRRRRRCRRHAASGLLPDAVAAMTSRARSSTSPPALSTAANPSARARAAVASPTANSAMPARALSRARARTPLALVHSTACTPARSGAGSSR